MGTPKQDMRVSAIPLTPVRTRERNDKKSQQPHFEDIMSERPDPSAIDHLSLPEDHLEDILALPIAAELRSRRSKASLGSRSDRTSSTTAFPNSSSHVPQNTSHVPQNTRDAPSSFTNPIHPDPYFLPHKRTDSLRKRSQSSPMSMRLDVSESPNTSAVDLSMQHYGIDEHATSSSSTAPSSSKKSRTAELNPSTPRHVPLTPTTTFSASKQRSKGSTNPPSGTSSRKSPNLYGTSSGPRRPLQSTTAGTSINRQASTPHKKPSSTPPPFSKARARSSSTSLLSKNIQAHDWDENSKPPWLDESPNYLYKSDIENVIAPPGSLADIARHAQGQGRSTPRSGGGDNAADASYSEEQQQHGYQGDMSTRSWDDVILPAVAKQIRAQQMLEQLQQQQQQQAHQQNGSSQSNKSSNITTDEDLLVTEWNPDGTPKKWRRINRKNPHYMEMQAQRQHLPQQQEQVSPTLGKEKELPQIEGGMLQPSPQERTRTQSQDRRSNVTDDVASHHHQIEMQNPSMSSQHLSVHPDARSTELQNNSNSSLHNRSPDRTGSRRELWDDPELSSPTTAAQNGFASAQHQLHQAGSQQQPYGNDGNMVSLSAKGERQDHIGGQQGQAEEKHGGGCCKCIVM